MTGDQGGETGLEPEPSSALPVEEMLTEISRSVHTATLYPPGHPSVEPLARQLLEELRPFLEGGGFSMGIAPEQLYSGDVQTDTESDVHRFLAKRLHAHDLARVTFLPGVDEEQVEEFLSSVAVAPEQDHERLGRQPRFAVRWPQISVESVQYERVTMGEAGQEAPEREDPDPSRPARLWLGLVRSVQGLPVELTEGEEEIEGEGFLSEDLSAVMLAESLEDASPSTVTPAVAGQFLRIAQELSATGGRDQDELRERFTKLVEALNSRTLYQMLRENSEQELRREFLLSSASWLPVGMVVDLVEAAAEAGDLDVSPWVLRLLAKMARHSEEDGDGGPPAESEARIRELARQAMTGWKIREDQPEQYTGALRGMSETARDLPQATSGQGLVDPLHVVQIALELDRLGPVEEAAFDRLRRTGRSGDLLAVLAKAPDNEVREELWSRMATRDTIRELLEKSPPDLDGVGLLIDRIGPAAAGPMLDLLEESESRSVRGKLFAFLSDLGPEIGDEVVERVDDDRWYVQRNMLALLSELEEVPQAFSAAPYAEHPHPAVRYEAYKLLLRDPDRRDVVVRRALEEDAPRVVRLGLVAAEDGLPDEALPRVLEHARDEELGDEVRSQAVRVLSDIREPEVFHTLLDLARRRRRWLIWRKELADPSPVVTGALERLAEDWGDRPEVQALLEQAAASESPRLRAVAAEQGAAS